MVYDILKLMTPFFKIFLQFIKTDNLLFYCTYNNFVYFMLHFVKKKKSHKLMQLFYYKLTNNKD